MKRILLLSLLLLPIVALAQYPTFSNKQKLGVQTTGDGLIYRGNSNPNYTPSNINNAYFYLDTTTSKLYLYSATAWQQIYPTASDTLSLGAYLLKSDTLSMLLPYLRKSDTISLSNRINNKLSLADTASMLLPYLKLADTTSMLTPYFRDNDTTMLNLITRFNSKLNTTDTVSLSNRIDLKLNKTDTISLSNRIDIKLNESDTISLSNRINKKLDTLYVNYPTYIDTITNKDTIQIAPSLVLTEGFGINVIGDSINIDSAVILATQQKQIAYVKNQSGVTIYKGQAVYSSGSSGNNKLVTLASSATEQTSSKTFGIVESDVIPHNGHGYIITFGVLNKINTDNLNEGSSIYLSNTPGQLTTTKPIAPLHMVVIGVCIRQQQNNGSIFVKIQNGFELDELHDVRLTDLVDKSSIYYNLSEKLWRDTTAALLVSDTASMLSKYVNTYSNQTGINGDKTFNNVVTIDSATVTGKLLVNTNISDAVKISSNTNSTNLELMNSSGTVSIKSSNKNMILQTDTTALVYLNGNNKKVGILTMNPQQELEIAGNVRIDSLNNNIVPTKMVGSDNNGDLTNVNLGEGLSFVNDTLKVDLTIIDTAIAASSITLAGHVTGTGSTNSTVNTTISNNVVTNDMLAGGISDSKLNTITTAGKVDNSATTATSSLVNNTIVLRNGTGDFTARDFTARNITATNFYGLASTATLANTIQSSNTTGIIKLTTSSNSVLPIITVPDVNATMATTNLSQTFGGTQTFNGTAVFTGNVTGLTSSTVGLGNVTNESKATMFTSPTFTGTVSGITKSMVGLSNVDNTSDVNKPISTATQTALNAKQNTLTFNTPLVKTNDNVTINTANTNTHGVLTFTDWNIFNNKQSQLSGTGFVKASGTAISYDNTSYLPLAGGTLTGTLNGINQNLNSNLTITDSIAGNPPRIYTSVKTGPSSTAPIRLALDQNASNGANMFMGGSQALGGEPTNPNIFFTDSRKAYASIGGIHTSGGTDNQSGHIVFNTTPSVNTIPLTERMRIAQDGAITMGNTLNTSDLITSSFTNTSNYSTSATNNNAFTIYNNTTSTNNIYGGLQFLIGQNSGAIPGGPGLAQIYAIRAGGASNPSTDLTFSTKSSSNGVLEKMRIKFDGKVGIGTSTPSYLLDVNGQIGSTGFIKSGGSSLQFLKADGSVDANTYLTTSNASSTYLPLTGGTLTGGLTGTTGTFNTRLGVGSTENSNITSLFTGGTGNQEIHFAHIGNTAGATVTLRLTNNLASLYTQGAYFQGIVNRGVNEMSGALGTNGLEYIRLRGVDDGGAVGVGIFNTNPSYNLDVTGTFRATSTTVLSSLGGSGNRMVVTNNSGVLSTQAIPTGTLVGTDTVSLSNRINTKVGLTGNEYINGTKTFGGLIVPTNGMQLTATGNNSNKLLGLNVSSIVGEITLGSGLSLSNNILSVNGSSDSTNLYLALNGPTIVLPTSMASQSTYFLHIDNVSTVTVTLPTASLNTNKSITIKNGGSGAVNSNANNVQRLTGSTSNIILLSGGGKFATLVSDGFNWITMAAN